MNIFKVLEEEINIKLGYTIIPFSGTMFNNNIIFFKNDLGNMYFNKNMLLDLFSNSSNKLLIYNYIQSEDNIWPIDFLKNYNYEYSPITIENVSINHLYKENRIYYYFYYINNINNTWSIYTSNQYKNHTIYIKSVNDIYSNLIKIFTKGKKKILFANIKHEDLISKCINNKNLFQKYMNIIYVNNNIYSEIEISNYINNIENLKQHLSQILE
jgi:hypothetical protein